MSTILDHQLERQAIIEKIKNRLLELCDKKYVLKWKHLSNYNGELIDYHLLDIDNEIDNRIEDYHQMINELKENWNLHYDY